METLLEEKSDLQLLNLVYGYDSFRDEIPDHLAIFHDPERGSISVEEPLFVSLFIFNNRRLKEQLDSQGLVR